MKQGFTLIEMTMVLLIVGLLVGSFVIPLGAQIDINNIKTTDQRLAQIKEALLGYAARNRRLPCPDTDNDGKENSASCGQEGNLPWADLGVDSKDAWGDYFRYRADTAHTTPQNIPCTISYCVACGLCTSTCCIGNISMCATTPCSECADQCSKCTQCGKVSPFYITVLPYDVSIPQTTNNALKVKNKADTVTFVENAVAIIFSNGKNKAADGSNATIDQTYTQDDFAPNDFDDRLIWLSDNELVSRLAAAGFRIK